MPCTLPPGYGCDDPACSYDHVCVICGEGNGHGAFTRQDTDAGLSGPLTCALHRQLLGELETMKRYGIKSHHISSIRRRRRLRVGALRATITNAWGVVPPTPLASSSASEQPFQQPEPEPSPPASEGVKQPLWSHGRDATEEAEEPCGELLDCPICLDSAADVIIEPCGLCLMTSLASSLRRRVPPSRPSIESLCRVPPVRPSAHRRTRIRVPRALQVTVSAAYVCTPGGSRPYSSTVHAAPTARSAEGRSRRRAPPRALTLPPSRRGDAARQSRRRLLPQPRRSLCRRP